MRPVEKNNYTNPLVHAASPYLRQHAHNPVYWHPWGKEALELAQKENKPILLSIGYSTCYWCHVMEREVFENASIAALMNSSFVNIKVDREEHPELDEIYMVARQLMTHEGGWPNNIWLTPDLKPFYAGGTFGPDEAYGKPAFPRLLEWLSHAWTTQEKEVRQKSDEITEMMKKLLVQEPANAETPPDISVYAGKLFALLGDHYDGRAGGFFQAPKFPHETFLQFLLTYHQASGDIKALDMVTHSLGKMAAGGIYDHVGCGFHRYAVDKEWYVPHFEKMLYNQSQLARLYTDAAVLSGNSYLADIAKSILDFSLGPFSDGNGGFYSAFDAETDGAEGAYYAWTAQELEALLTPEEIAFFTTFYALADIPQFPGHKHADGQVIVARKPLDLAAREKDIPYLQLAAMSGRIMNKLLAARNKRQSVGLDDKIITGWNGLMIDAYAHAGQAFNRPNYIARARKAADFLLEHAIDNDGKLHRIYAAGHAQLDATLEDYAYLIKGLLTLCRVDPEHSLLEGALLLMARADELFYDATGGGYFFTQPSGELILRIKNGEDSAMPSANAVMLHNNADLFDITKDEHYRHRAEQIAATFLNGPRIQPEFSTMVAGAIRLQALVDGKPFTMPWFNHVDYATEGHPSPDDVALIGATVSPADAKPGDACELLVTLELKDGWHINAHEVKEPYLIATQMDVQGNGVKLLDVVYPEASPEGFYQGRIIFKAKLKLTGNADERLPLKVRLRFQPCHGTTCHAVKDISLTV